MSNSKRERDLNGGPNGIRTHVLRMRTACPDQLDDETDWPIL